ncbi:MAG: hypothetical protein CMM07_05850 [Rhodopirellula sp.]|nr:hypothetical protein [Rhodopirellula sp.]
MICNSSKPASDSAESAPNREAVSRPRPILPSNSAKFFRTSKCFLKAKKRQNPAILATVKSKPRPMTTHSDSRFQFLIRNLQTALAIRREDLYLSASSLWQPRSSKSNFGEPQD